MTQSKDLKRTRDDVAHTVAKAGLSAIPFVGGTIAELLSFIWEPALNKRRDAWLQEIANNLEVLEAKVEGFRLDQLSTNDTFITTAIQASQAAIRNHQKDKLEALRNAVLNSALDVDLSDELQLVLLSLVERLTTTHIKLLRIIFSRRVPLLSRMYDSHEEMDPNDICDDRIMCHFRIPCERADDTTFMNNYAYRIEERNQFLNVVLIDLDRQGLISIGKEKSYGNREQWRIEMTILGRKLIKFISLPKFLEDATP